MPPNHHYICFDNPPNHMTRKWTFGVSGVQQSELVMQMVIMASVHTHTYMCKLNTATVQFKLSWFHNRTC